MLLSAPKWSNDQTSRAPALTPLQSNCSSGALPACLTSTSCSAAMLTHFLRPIPTPPPSRPHPHQHPAPWPLMSAESICHCVAACAHCVLTALPLLLCCNTRIFVYRPIPMLACPWTLFPPTPNPWPSIGAWTICYGCSALLRRLRTTGAASSALWPSW